MLEDIFAQTEKKMQGAIEHMLKEFKSVRTGKVSASMLDGIKVEYYGTPTPLEQVGSILVADATTIVSSPWEKQLLGEIESALQRANLGVHPNNDGEQIKLFFPPMTIEQRKEAIKQMKGMGEKARIAIRNDRRAANDKIKKLEKDKEITQDESKQAQDRIQKLTDKYVGEVDRILKEKESNVMKV